MLPALNIPTLDSPLCPSRPHTVQQYLSHYRFPSPSPSLSPSHPMFPYLPRSLSHRPACASHPHLRHCHCHRQDGSIHCSVLRDPPSSHQHHPRRLSHPNSVVKRPGSRLACTAGSLVAQSLPWDHRYRNNNNAHWCVEPFPSWLSANWSNRLDLRRHWGCPTSNCSFDHGFYQTFAWYIRGRLPTTPEKVNSCACGEATSAGIVKSGELWLDQERLYHNRGPRPSHPWRRKHCISIWVHRCVPRWIPWYYPDPTTGVDL